MLLKGADLDSELRLMQQSKRPTTTEFWLPRFMRTSGAKAQDILDKGNQSYFEASRWKYPSQGQSNAVFVGIASRRHPGIIWKSVQRLGVEICRPHQFEWPTVRRVQALG